MRFSDISIILPTVIGGCQAIHDISYFAAPVRILADPTTTTTATPAPDTTTPVLADFALAVDIHHDTRLALDPITDLTKAIYDIYPLGNDKVRIAAVTYAGTAAKTEWDLADAKATSKAHFTVSPPNTPFEFTENATENNKDESMGITKASEVLEAEANVRADVYRIIFLFIRGPMAKKDALKTAIEAAKEKLETVLLIAIETTEADVRAALGCEATGTCQNMYLAASDGDFASLEGTITADIKKALADPTATGGKIMLTDISTGLPTYAIALIIIGSIAGALLLVAVFVACYRKKHNASSTN